MIETTLVIDGMMCGMCENHVNDALRRACSVDKVKSSHKTGKTVVVADRALDEDEVRKALDPLGYTLVSCEAKPCEKRGLFSKLKR